MPSVPVAMPAPPAVGRTCPNRVNWQARMEMDGLILFSHGSLLCGAGEALHAHAERLRACGDFRVVEVGYMNYSEPAFATAVARCVRAGVTRIGVVPYFLVPGKFVRADLPAHVATAEKEWPGITFVIAPPLGFHEALADALLDLASAASPPESWSDDLKRASDFCEGNPRCPLYGTPQCPRAPSPAADAAPVLQAGR